MKDHFYRISSSVTRVVGSPWALLVAFGVIVTWAVTGPIFHFSDTWQLFINTGTTVVTFLMVFVIQATQNREAKVTQLKLDELIHAVRGARDSMIALEEAPEESVEHHSEEMKELARETTEAQPDGGSEASGQTAGRAGHDARHPRGEASSRRLVAPRSAASHDPPSRTGASSPSSRG